jgi:phosphate-selective porin OprO/OprP
MKKALLFLFLTTFLYTNAQEKNSFTTYWKDGLRIESTDKNFKIKMGGRVQYDVMFIHQNDSLNQHFDAKNGTELRRARFYTSGTIYKNIKFKLQLEFAPGKVVIKDAFIQLTKIPVAGNIRIGHMKEPFGLDKMTSSNFVSFMERSLASQFDFDRSLGILIFNHHFKKRLSWATGYFYPDFNTGRIYGNQYHLTFRVTGLPVYQTENKYRVLHLGLGYSYQFHNNKIFSYKTRPEAHLAPKYLSLGIQQLYSNNAFKGEFALVLGSISFQSEYTLSSLKPTSDSSYTYQENNYLLDAFFGTVTWFITGEHKNYNPSKTAFGRIKPKKNFGKGGAGAFELALRFSTINLNKKDLNGGKMNNITFGLNWYLNPATKFAFNYVYSDVENLGKASIFQMRFQITF